MSDRSRMAWLLVGALSALVTGCAGCASYRRCDAPPAPLLAALPARLSDTGLYAERELAEGQLAEGVVAYEPEFPLWSDGATKRRWVSLPPGSRIDTTDMDDWSFPVGTRLWKEFSVAGRRIETRTLRKVGPGRADWAGAAYVWDADGRDATLAREGMRDAFGSGHDVPSATDCVGCHGGRKSYVLGFSAVQLSGVLPLSLDDLVSRGWLTRAPDAPPRIPGDGATREALGYLHANCGHCHNRERPERGDGARCYDPERSIDFWQSTTASAAPQLSPAVASTVPRFVTPGEPDASRLIALVSRRGPFLHMPPLGTRQVDEAGVQRLREWVESLGPASGLAATAPQRDP